MRLTQASGFRLLCITENSASHSVSVPPAFHGSCLKILCLWILVRTSSDCHSSRGLSQLCLNSGPSYCRRILSPSELSSKDPSCMEDTRVWVWLKWLLSYGSSHQINCVFCHPSSWYQCRSGYVLRAARSQGGPFPALECTSYIGGSWF